MNKLEIITKVKNPPGDFLFLVSFYREMFLALPRSCNCCWIMDCESSLFFFYYFSSANKCLLKVATYAAQLEQYQKAIDIFEQVWWRILANIWSLILDTAWIPLWSLFAEQCQSVISGWSLRNGEHSSQIRCQGLLLQGSTLSLLCRHAECKSKHDHNLCLCS